MQRFPGLISFLLIAALSSCVSMKQFKDLQGQNDSTKDENSRLKMENEKLSVDNREYASRLDNLQKAVQFLTEDTMRKYEKINELNRNLDKLSREYNTLSETQDAIVKGSSRESMRLLKQLQTTQDELQKKEDEIAGMENNLRNERLNLEQTKAELDKRNARMLELEQILARKDSAVNSIKQKVAAALLGFENEGLSVHVVNGKVYVSLEEKLLFKSGSINVEPKGISALKKLARMLEQNPDINITIEGHTDTDPVIPSAAMKDNWDLSVKRATSIVRILLDGTKIDPKRLTASGHGEFMPVDPAKTPEAKQKNRRTEIILTPKLDELFNILNNN